jgi:hypothetical protein
VYFEKGGDGLRSYFVAMYHAKYDKDLFHTESMNYPFGENIFFTDSQPLISNVIKLLVPGIDLSNYLVGIINGSMLLGIILGAVFICLIFLKFEVHPIVGSIAAVGIAFLSPQIGRMGGHFSLSYIFAVPATIYLLLSFHEKQNYKATVGLAILGIFLMSAHIYLFAMYAALVLMYWVYSFRYLLQDFSWKKVSYPSIQLLFPILLYVVLMVCTDKASNRVAYPWGFMAYRAYPESVFLPLHKPYLRFITRLFQYPKYISWEGYSFIGLAAFFGSLILIAKSVRWLRGKSKIIQTGQRGIDYMYFIFVASFLLLFYSFGIPFVFNLEKWVDYIGPLRQIRGVGRFAWVFFYTANIGTFILLTKWRFTFRRINIPLVILSLSLIVLYYEAWVNIREKEMKWNNRIGILSGTDDSSFNNKIQNLHTTDYEALITVPYFIAGAEYYARLAPDEIVRYAYVISLKTGIPLVSLMAGRTSLNHLRDQLELVYPAFSYPRVLEEYEPDKNLLILTAADAPKSYTEKRLCLLADTLYTFNNLILLKISSQEYTNFFRTEADLNRNSYNHNLKLDTTGTGLFASRLTLSEKETLYGSKELDKWNVILDYEFDFGLDTINAELQVWIGDITEDLVLSTTFGLEVSDNNRIVSSFVANANALVTAIDRNKVLLTLPIGNVAGASRIVLKAENPRMTFQNLTVGEISIKANRLKDI